MANPVPPVPPAQPAAAPATPLPLGQSVPANVTELPPSLTRTERTIILRGEVQQQNRDGSVRITTPRGPVDVRLPNPQPQNGQRVEVTLPAGSPPSTATVRAATPQPPVPQQPTTSNPQPPTQANAQTPQGQNTPAPQTPINNAAPRSGTAPQPNVPTSTANTAAPQTTNPSTPATQITINTSANADQINPQRLLNFLKSSLQNVIKAPNTTPGAQNTANPSSLSFGEKPLQIGQLLRLITLGRPNATPLTPNVQTAPATQNILTSNAPLQSPVLPNTQTALSTPLATIPAIATGTNAALTTLTTQIANILQNVLTTPVNAQPSGTPVLTTQTSGSERILLPLGNPNIGTTTPGTNTAQKVTQLGTQNLLPQPANNIIQPNAEGVIAKPGQQSINIPVGHQKTMIPNIIDARVHAQIPPTTTGAIPTPQIATLLNGTPTSPVLFAQFTGQLNAQGLPIVEVPLFSNPNALNILTPGAQKTFLPLTIQFPAQGLVPSSVLRLDIVQAGQFTTLSSLQGLGLGDGITWEALDEILRNLPAQAQPGQSATQIIQSTIPKPGSVAFSAGVLMFMAAARGGDITAWLGERGMDTIRNINRADLLSRLGNDFASMARTGVPDDGVPTGEWRSLSLPLLFGYNELSRAQMHYRSFEQDQEDGSGERNPGTRFILDLNMSRMGPIQIDGYSVGKKLDVTLRTEQSFSASMRETMRAGYHNAVEGIGFAGQLNFSANPDKSDWIDFDDTQPVFQSANLSS